MASSQQDNQNWGGLFAHDLGVPVGERHACPYMEGRAAAERAFLADRMPSGFYQALMDNGWRRSGPIVYKPACPECTACQPIRLPVHDFRPDRAQRRVLTRNADLRAVESPPVPTQETFDLFVRYQQHRHAGDMCTTWHEFSNFLYASPTETREFRFLLDERLAAVAIADLGPDYISAVYTWFDPDLEARSLGTWAILWFIDLARQRGITHYYLGYYIADCRKMNYKARFRPHEIGDSRGGWSRLE
ncbi:MAG: arginyltransferase [Candidatus Sumerlaeia bacterium]|nr:arginyltransferase [Candidatus Sumerlaeia bacterium]